MTGDRWIDGARGVAAAVGLCGALAGGAAAQSREPAQVAVVGTDYAFLQFPATIAAGRTLFSFENRGEVRHEMSMVLLKPGVTIEQVMQKGPGALGSRQLVDRGIGILVARPGESSGGQLFVDLLPGRTYVVACSLKDAPDKRPDAPPHLALGMVTSFQVP